MSGKLTQAMSFRHNSDICVLAPSGLVARFPLIFSLVAAGVFFFILFIGLVACLMPVVEWHFPSDGPHQIEPEEKPRRRRRSRRPERVEKEKERPSSESRPKTPIRRSGGSSPRSRQAVSVPWNDILKSR